MIIPVNDLQRHNGAIREEIDAAIRRVLDRGWYILGPEVEAFEQEFAAYCGIDHCVAVANGTDALELALRAIGVEKGDRVGTVANAGMYGTTAILRAGAIPVYIEVDPITMTMSPEHLAAAWGLKAAIVTHLYGRVAEMNALADSAVPIIEDCAQAHGAEGAVSDWSAASCFSFYPTKNLGALGDGGAVVTNLPAIADRVRALRQYGWTSKYHAEIAGGWNSRMDDAQAAVLRAKLPYLARWNQRRREIGSTYDKSFGFPRREYAPHLYVVCSTERDHLRSVLKANGIGAEIHYPTADHLQPAILQDVELPVTEGLCEQVLTLPCFPEMTDAEVSVVVERVVETGIEISESLIVG